MDKSQRQLTRREFVTEQEDFVTEKSDFVTKKAHPTAIIPRRMANGDNSAAMAAHFASVPSSPHRKSS